MRNDLSVYIVCKWYMSGSLLIICSCFDEL